MIEFTNKNQEILAFCFVAVVGILLIVSSPEGFWILDEGNKIIFAENFFREGNFEIRDSAAEISPGHGSFRKPFTIPAEDGISQITVFSPIFIALVSPLIKLGGLKLALIIPLSCTILLLISLRRLAQKMNLPFEWYTILVLGLASPLLFYSVTLWEHSLALLLGTLALNMAASAKPSSNKQFFAGALFIIAAYIRPEMLLFAAVVWIYWFRNKPVIMTGFAAGIVIFMGLNYLMVGSPFPLQISANFGLRWDEMTVGNWFLSRADAVYALLAQSDSAWISIIPLAGLVMYLFLPGVFKFALPLSLIAVILLNWFDRTPFYHFGDRGSLLLTAPLFLAALLHKTSVDSLKKLRTVVIAIGFLIILTSPVYRGVHFGPRLLLPILPLMGLMITPMMKDLSQKGNVFKLDAVYGLLIAQILVTIWGMGLLEQRRAENVQRAEVILAKSKPAIVTLQWWLPQELPDLFFQRQVFTPLSELEYKAMLIDFYRRGIRWYTILIKDGEKSPILDFVKLSPSKQIGAFTVPSKFPSMSLLGLDYAIGFDVNGAAKLADELGVYFGQTGRLEEAEFYLRCASEWSRETGKYHFNLGYCLGKMGKTEDALKELERAQELDMGNETIAKMIEEIKLKGRVVQKDSTGL